jgi:hypothetical protein
VSRNPEAIDKRKRNQKTAIGKVGEIKVTNRKGFAVSTTGKGLASLIKKKKKKYKAEKKVTDNPVRK